MSFGKRLRVARQSAGQTQAELGSAVDVSNSYIAHLETGRRAPNPELVERLEESLGLEPGTLGAPEEWSPNGRKRQLKATLLANFEQAVLLRESGSTVDLVPQLNAIIEDARLQGQRDLVWLACRMRVESEMDAGAIDAASQHAVELLEMARKTNDSTLTAVAETKCASLERLKGNEAAARSHGAAAVIASMRDGVSREHRADALCAAIAAGGAQVAEWATMLRTIYPTLDVGSMKGRTAWVLANVAFADEDIDEGLRWQDEASRHLTPAGQFRSWVKWPAVAAQVRVNVGVLDGVADLLEEARVRVALSASDEEMAGLAASKARYLVAIKDRESARRVLLEALESLEVGVASRGHLRLELSEVAAADGDLAEASAAALSAAKLFTEAGSLREAQKAFEQWTALQPTA